MPENSTSVKPLDPVRERSLDWLTALMSVLIISLIYYRWQAVAMELLAIGGYLMATVLLPSIRHRFSLAAMTGLLAAFCLPATAPVWLAAVIGALAAVIEALPALIGIKWPDSPLALPILHPVPISYLFVRLVFAGYFTQFAMPAQWAAVDTLSAATPLSAFHGVPAAASRLQMLFGIHAGAIGETCTAAILLSLAYLIIRKRVRLIAPAAMLATISMLSWIIWNSPLYALMAGGAALGALLLADCTYAPAKWPYQLAVGLIAGIVTVIVRRCGPWSEGVALGLIAAEILTPLLPFIERFFRWLWQLILPIRKKIKPAH